MNLKVSFRMLVLGLLSWAIPFAVSLLFYGPNGALFVSHELFTSIMVIVGGGSGAWLVVLAFRRMAANVMSGLLIGLCWACLNLILDWIVLLPMMHATYGAYFADIGLQYLLMPIMAAAIGAASSDKSRTHSLASRQPRLAKPVDIITETHA